MVDRPPMEMADVLERFQPTLEMYDSLAKAKQPRPLGFNIGLSEDAILSVGLITLQWGALYDAVLKHIKMIRGLPSVPDELRNKTPDLRQESNITYLRELGRHVYAQEREGAAKLFDDNICRIFEFKADRDKLAHGTYASVENSEFDGIIGMYKSKKFRLSSKRIRAIADGIGRCHAFLLPEFFNWVRAEGHARNIRAWLEKRAQQDHLPDGPYLDTLDKPPPPRGS